MGMPGDFSFKNDASLVPMLCVECRSPPAALSFEYVAIAIREKRSIG